MTIQKQGLGNLTFAQQGEEKNSGAMDQSADLCLVEHMLFAGHGRHFPSNVDGNGFLRRDEPAWVDEVEYGHGRDHHSSIKSDEKPLVRDEIPRPALQQLDCSVDTSDIDADDGEGHGSHQGHDGAAHRAQAVSL